MSAHRYGVIGNPVAHSRSPFIHESFARQTNEAVVYERILATVDSFEHTLDTFRAEGGRGVNVTLPFKELAFRYAQQRSARASLAGAVNTLSFEPQGVVGDNTDGAGLLQDLDRLTRSGARAVLGASVLLLGAGGAARGILGPLLDAGAGRIVIASRDPTRGAAMRASFADHLLVQRIDCIDWDQLDRDHFDLVINATSSGVTGTALQVPARVFKAAALVYDLSYGQGSAVGSTAFLQTAQREGALRISDGLGMLVEQAAESFFIWRGVRPEAASVLQALRDRADR